LGSVELAKASWVRSTITLTGANAASQSAVLDRRAEDPMSSGIHRGRPELNQALATVRAGDTLVVPKLDRLARSVPDARTIGDSRSDAVPA
jgi:DNA invertase Pin-like site-specific DNA recombinase